MEVYLRKYNSVRMFYKSICLKFSFLYKIWIFLIFYLKERLWELNNKFYFIEYINKCLKKNIC